MLKIIIFKTESPNLFPEHLKLRNIYVQAHKVHIEQQVSHNTWFAQKQSDLNCNVWLIICCVLYLELLTSVTFICINFFPISSLFFIVTLLLHLRPFQGSWAWEPENGWLPLASVQPCVIFSLLWRTFLLQGVACNLNILSFLHHIAEMQGKVHDTP